VPAGVSRRPESALQTSGPWCPIPGHQQLLITHCSTPLARTGAPNPGQVSPKHSSRDQRRHTGIEVESSFLQNLSYILEHNTATYRELDEDVVLQPKILLQAGACLRPIAAEQLEQLHRLHKPVAKSAGRAQEPVWGNDKRFDADSPPQHAQTRSPPQHGGDSLPDAESSQYQAQPARRPSESGLRLKI
jgi:hypothetical protein